MSQTLTRKQCVPCQGGISPLAPDQIESFFKELDSAWQNIDNKKISREFVFKTFPEAIGFLNEIAGMAEKEGHHPDLTVHYNRLTIELWTHKIDGLHENDFIIAAKIDKLYNRSDL